MTATTLPAARIGAPPIDTRSGTVVLDVVVPVHNEERDLERCVRALHAHLARALPFDFRITVADNASTGELELF